MSKPTNKPGWNPTDPSKVVEPNSTKKAQGWSAGEKPTAEHFNWLMKTVSEWIDYVDTAGVQGPAGQQGPEGPQGPQGPAGSVDTSTLNAINSRITSLETSIGTATVPSVNINFPYTSNAAPNEYNAGAVAPGNSKTIDWSNGSSQYLLLDASCTAVTFTNAVAGNTYYLRVQQGGYGLKLMSGWPLNVVWKNNTVPTISTDVWTVDVLGFYFDGTNYYGDITKGYYVPPVGADTKNGYAALLSGQLNKFNLNEDGAFSVINAYFGLEYTSTGTSIFPRITAFTGQIARGTQSSTHGYRMGAVYADNTALNGKIHKVAFANDTANSVGFFASGFQGTAVPMARQITQSSLAAYKLTGGSANSTPNALRTNKFLFSTETGSTPSTSVSVTSWQPNPGNGQSGQNPVAFSSLIKGSFVGGTNASLSSNNSVVNIVFSNETIAFAGFSSIVIFGSPTTADGRAVRSGDGISSPYHGYATNFIGSGSTNDVATSHSLYKMSLDTDVWSTVQASVTDGSQVRHGAVSGLFNGYFLGGDSANNAVSNFRARKIQYASDTYSIHAYTFSSSANECAGFAG